ncbi:ATP-grasp fold amidoligase family protein [Gottschalkiaceae bacterium SANA]|nr:ATP-grasp fold amidoligase family protein [Gottschalkiaceae bacterium SANA]
MYKKLKKLFNIEVDPIKSFKSFFVYWVCKNISDERYLKFKFRMIMRRKLDIKQPKTFNEKIQWLKLYDRKAKYVELVDKYEVRKHVKALIGEEYLIPLLGVWPTFQEIDFSKLPNRFVLKCTHDSGGVVVCQDKGRLDWDKIGKKMDKQLAKNYYYSGREWPYKNIKPRIICEDLIESESGGLPNDYKFHCFNGKAKNVMICTDRLKGQTQYYFFDRQWKYLPCLVEGWNAPEGFTLPKPEKLDEMFALAETMAKGFAFVRVDLYCEKGKIYFGELTLYPESGFDDVILPETDAAWGRDLQLPDVESCKVQ